MDSFQVYRTYLALRLHFTNDNYDIFQMEGRVKASKNAFLKRKDLLSIERLARKYSEHEIIDFLVANFVSGDRWGGIFDQDAHETYLTWLGRQERLTYMFTQDIDFLSEKSSYWNDLVDVSSSSHPYIIKAFLGNNISVESLTIVNIVTNKNLTNLNLADTFIWPDLKRLILKYTPFLKIDDGRFRKIFGSRIRFETTTDQKSGGNSSSSSGYCGVTERTNYTINDRNPRDSEDTNQGGSKPTRNQQKNLSVALSDYFI